MTKHSQTLPNFLIVGAAKSGTTALYNFLKRHPDVFLPWKKETRFFVSEIYSHFNSDDPRAKLLRKGTIGDLSNYASLFKGSECYNAVGEVDASYLYYHNHSIPKIRCYIGEPRIIIVLRNPIERAWSAYMHLRRDGHETESIERCLALEESRMQANWSMLNFYVNMGMYYQQVRSYLESFRYVSVHLFDDLRKDPLAVMKTMYDFLEIDNHYKADFNRKYNVSGIPRFRLLHKVLAEDNWMKRIISRILSKSCLDNRVRLLHSRLLKVNMTKGNHSMSSETEMMLREKYRDDVCKLQALIQRDLSMWHICE